MSNRGRLADKVVIITGTAQGIGESAVRLFAAEVALWLLSDHAPFVTGSVVTADGGSTIV